MATISPGWGILLGYISCLITCTSGQTFCQSSWCLDGSECVYKDSNYRCECIDGYTGGIWNLSNSPNTFTCSDIDECNSLHNQCETNTTCENYNGGYRCNCPRGKKLWKDPVDNQHCIGLETDICESSVSVCGDGTRCLSTPTGTTYACTCLQGYTGQNFSVNSRSLQCYDIDECTTGASICGQFATCFNEMGSYRCQCNPGITTWIGPLETKACTDIDICSTDLHICGRGSNCVSHINSGRYDCTCMDGFAGLTFINVSRNLQCSDTDECSSSTLNTCDTDSSTCVNSLGSYSCECNTGYSHTNNNNKRCEDTDECSSSTLNTCDTDSSTCVNSLGSYRCECNTGYFQTNNADKLCEGGSNVELAVGLSVSAVISLVIIGLLILWCTRGNFKKNKQPEKSFKKSNQDLASLSGRSDQSSFAMTPSALLTVSSKSSSVRFKQLQPNGVMKTSHSRGVYHVNTITERMVRSYRRKKLGEKSHASSYVSRSSSIGSQISKPSYFDTRSNGLAAISDSNPTKISENQDTPHVVNGKGKGGKGVKQKGKPGGLTISANKLPEDVHVVVESAIVTPVEKVFSPDDQIPTEDDSIYAMPSRGNNINSTESGSAIGQVPSIVISAGEIAHMESSIGKTDGHIPQSILKKDGSMHAGAPATRNSDIGLPVSLPANSYSPLAPPMPLLDTFNDLYLYDHVESDRLPEHNQGTVLPRVKSFRSALQSQGEPEISELLTQDTQADKIVLNEV